MTLPRLTIRRSMLAVAIMAAVIWITILAMRSLEYLRQADRRTVTCLMLMAEIKMLSVDVERARVVGTSTSSLESAIAEREKALAEERRAAALFRERTWRPWKTVRYR